MVWAYPKQDTENRPWVASMVVVVVAVLVELALVLVIVLLLVVQIVILVVEKCINWTFMERVKTKSMEKWIQWHLVYEYIYNLKQRKKSTISPYHPFVQPFVLANVNEIHRSPVDSPHKEPAMWIAFPLRHWFIEIHSREINMKDFGGK